MQQTSSFIHNLQAASISDKVILFRHFLSAPLHVLFPQNKTGDVSLLRYSLAQCKVPAIGLAKFKNNSRHNHAEKFADTLLPSSFMY